MNKSNTILGLTIILLLAFLFQYRYMNEFPTYIHAWAQSDRYALALGFTNNHLNFFKPQTFIMNPQFPGDFLIPKNESITAVNFPIHDYIPAVIMKLSGIRSPWIFRLYILLYSMAGLFFVFKCSMLLSKNMYKSILIILFTATSPVFVYYQGGFLPTIPSLANACIGFYFYVHYFLNNQKKSWVACVVFLTIAALSRTTFIIPLVAVYSFEIVRIRKSTSNPRGSILPVILSICIILMFNIYDYQLRTKYGSIFLNHLMPPSNFQNAGEILKAVLDNWGNQYFSMIHYMLVILLISGLLYNLALRKIKVEKQLIQLLVLVTGIMIGCFFFLIVMLKQFPVHDYYFLDSFFLPTILLIIIGLSCVPLPGGKYFNLLYFVFILIVSIFLTVNAIHTQQSRRQTGPWDRTYSTIHNFTGSSDFLDSLKIAKDARILVIDAYAPNIPFILLNRKGYAIMNTTKENIQHALTWKYDDIIFQDEFFISDIYENDPEIIKRIDKIADNGKISICHLKDQSQQDLFGFLGLSHKSPIMEKTMTFESITDTLWQNVNTSTQYAYSGTRSGYLIPTMDYGLTYKFKTSKELASQNRTLLISSYFLKNTAINAQIVVSILSNGKNVYYKYFNIKDNQKITNTWVRTDMLFQLPVMLPMDEIGIYIYNPKKEKVYYDDFTFKIY